MTAILPMLLILLVPLLSGCSHVGRTGSTTGHSLFEPAQLTFEERSEIEALIQSDTDEKIIGIFKDRPDGLKVLTGEIRGPLDGGGQTFRLKRVGSRWVIQGRDLWVS